MMPSKKLLRLNQLNLLHAHDHDSCQLILVERKTPEPASHYFNDLMNFTFEISGKVETSNAETDISHLLSSVIPEQLQSGHFYQEWINDMAAVCCSFGTLQNSDVIAFWLGTERSCGRYHVDNVPYRALVTYAGKGTEYLPDEAADRQAYETGKTNADIVKDVGGICFVDSWDVAIFKGGARGLLHRSPDQAINGFSVMMRLDTIEFWDRFPPSKSINNRAIPRKLNE